MVGRGLFLGSHLYKSYRNPHFRQLIGSFTACQTGADDCYMIIHFSSPI